MANKRSENKILLASLFFVSAVIFLLVFSWTTSPFFTFHGYDSSIFKSMGRFTAEGLTPYRDFFDHKGPIIIFLEYIGYGLFKSDYTLLLLQAIFLAVALYGVYKIARLFMNNKKSILLALSTLLVCGVFMSSQGGNTVEEWFLPFIIWSSYYVVKFFAYKEKEHSFKASILYGVTVAFAAFSRMTNAMPILILVFVVLIYLIIQKKWINIFKNILSFIVGALIITVPIIIWFVANGALKEMLHATFVFNYKYMRYRSFVPDSMRLLRHFVGYLLPFVLAAVLQITMIVKKKDVWLNVALLIQSVTAVAMQLSSALFPHYLIVWVPTIVITLILVVKDYAIMKWFARGYVLALVVLFIGISFIAFRRYGTYLKGMAKDYDKCCNDVYAHVPDKNKDIISINNNAYIYLATDMKPCYKYYHTQDLHSYYDGVTKNEWYCLVKSNKADYIIVSKFGESPINNILRRNYHLLYENNDFALIEKN